MVGAYANLSQLLSLWEIGALSYENLVEDPGSISYMITDPRQVHILSQAALLRAELEIDYEEGVPVPAAPGCQQPARISMEENLISDFSQFLSAQVEELLEPNGYECGWTNGGCRILADALVQWSEGALSLAAVWERFPSGYVAVTHVVARIDDIYIDGDGPGLEDELLDRRPAFRKPRTLWMGEYDSAYCNADIDPVVSDQLAGRLKERFGQFDKSAFSCAEQNSEPMRL